MLSVGSGESFSVSMKSGLEDRNNRGSLSAVPKDPQVSMKSGLEDRNNTVSPTYAPYYNGSQ